MVIVQGLLSEGADSIVIAKFDEVSGFWYTPFFFWCIPRYLYVYTFRVQLKVEAVIHFQYTYTTLYFCYIGYRELSKHNWILTL